MSDDRNDGEIKVQDKRRFKVVDGEVVKTNPDEEEAKPKDDGPQTTPAAAPSVEKEAAAPEMPHAESSGGEEGRGAPVASFDSLIFSLVSSAMMYMGDIADPDGKSMKDLNLAKQTIDLLGILSQKTQGNLTPDEEKFLSNNLRDLRLRFVLAKK